MPTSDIGIKHCIARLGACPDVKALRRVWDSLGIAYQNHPDVAAFKDKMKAALSEGAA